MTASQPRKPARRPPARRPPARRSLARRSTTRGAPDAAEAAVSEDQLAAAILRQLRRFPNQTVDLEPLASELRVDPFRIQLAVERLGRRRMVVVPFIEPGTAGGATLTEKGLRWLIAREGGKPADVPEAFKPASARVRSEDEAARLPRAQVYGLRR